MNKMSLNELPIHVLRAILDNITITHYSNIALISKLWYSLIIKKIYQNPNLISTEKFKLFSTTVQRNSKLANMVKQLDCSMIPSRWDHITSNEVGELLLACPNIYQLNLCHILLNDSIIQIIVNQYKDQMTHLNLDHCFTISAETLAHIGELKNLIHLDLSYTELNNSSLTIILINCGQLLESLSIEGCEEVTDESIKLISKLKKLNYCNLEGCYGILGDYNVGEWEPVFTDSSSDED